MADPTFRRSPERAAAVLDRAAKMRSNRAGWLDKRLFDPQMRTPGKGQAPLNFDYLKPEHVTPKGTQSVSTRAIVSDQPTISIKSVKGKIGEVAKGQPQMSGGKLPQLLLHNGQYHVFDGNHRVTAIRALGGRTIQGQVYELKPGVGRPAPSIANGINGPGRIAFGAVGIGTVAASSALAYRNAKDRGASDLEASTRAALAGAGQSSTPLVLSSGLALAEHYGSAALKTAAGTFGRALLPASMAGHAAAYAWQAYRQGADAAGIAKAAGWGAVNGVVPIDLMRDAYGAVTRKGPQQAAFNAANTHFAQSHMTEAPKAQDTADRNRKRGTQNEANLKAIIANRQQRAQESAAQ